MKTFVEQKRSGFSRTWLMLILPPVLFLIAIIAAIITIGLQTQGDAQAIETRVPFAMPYILLAVQVMLLGMFWIVARGEGTSWREIGWKVAARQSWPFEGLIGGGVGIAVALLYEFALSPLLTWLQFNVGDYVPPEQIAPTLGSALLPFFIANVLLAPFVEENIYRGYALTRLAPRLGTPLAVLISCLFFGLLHWAGGFWYIILTGVVAGGLFSGLFLWRKNIIAPFAAHLALNLIEFLFVAFAQ